jgi:EamA domain-containing membrane protein RarD
VPWIKSVSTVFGLCVLVLAAFTCRSAITRRREPELLCYALAVAAVTIASPICWTHHMTAFIAPLAIIARRFLDEPRLRSPTILATAFASAILTGAFYDARHLSGLPLGLLTGFEFYGGLLLLGTLVVLSRHDDLTGGNGKPAAGALSA